MFDSLFFSSTTTTTVSYTAFLVSVVSAMVLGLALSWTYCFRSRFTRSFVITTATLPAIVAVVIMMVNGNVGAGVAVAGGFSLVRFRSVPGKARDIAFIFLSMCVGLVCGMGYVALAVLVTVLIGGMNLVLQLTGLGLARSDTARTLRITVPEELERFDLLDDCIERYTTRHELASVKTTGMGSLYKLTYDMDLKSLGCEHKMIDELRCRNGNLEIAITHQEVSNDEI